MKKEISQNIIQKNEDILYVEWVPTGIFVKCIIIFVCLLIGSLGFIIPVFIPEDYMFIGFIFFGISLFILLIYWNYRALKIILTTNQLEVKYGIFNHKKIFLSKISSCDITKARFRIYGGVGIRLGLDGSVAYNTDFGEAVKLSFHSGRPFVFSTRNPKKLCDLINELLI